MTKAECAVSITVPSDGTYLCTEVALLENSGGSFLYAVRLATTDEAENFCALFFAEYDMLHEYVGAKVRCVFRSELVEGINSLVIVNFTVMSVVSTLDKEEGYRLYTKDIKETKSNVLFEQITETDPMLDAIVYVAGHKLIRTSHTSFILYDIVDRHHRHAECRLFNPVEPDLAWSGAYGAGDLSFSSQYGFRTMELRPIPHYDSYEDPVVAICKKYVQSNVELLPEKWETALTKMGYVDNLYKGCHDTLLFQTAIALHLAQDVHNVSAHLDRQRVIMAIVAQTLHCTAETIDDRLSPDMRSTLLLVKNGLVSVSALNAIDQSADKVYLDNAVSKSFLEIAAQIVQVERSFNIEDKVIKWT